MGFVERLPSMKIPPPQVSARFSLTRHWRISSKVPESLM
jgi:hypothetical protein